VAIQAHIESVEDQQSLRNQIVEAGLAAFVADGAILPRASVRIAPVYCFCCGPINSDDAADIQ
jgi:predicted ABC-class ATPase